MIDAKDCRLCKRTLPIKEFREYTTFAKSGKGYTYYSPECYSCEALKKSVYNRKNKAQVNARNRTYREQHKEELNEKDRRRKKLNALRSIVKG